ncbi:isoleucyl-tRNA synthetase [Piromyces finnis]|uniref:Isoleucine--tRNA ligase, cytoplasmic n=1 Tax=Piromyces finnis TaxID=1754191 RepID=A0A1Y1VIE6_9FUNG|nr:isoleucyl-tRNA synthetase [Piromyces finnis]|eukprot:ORX56468.1 isoleucyl-tRNA synthetase [Piromyces finnis]
MPELKDVPSNISFPKSEEETLKFWEEIKAFETSLKMSEGKPAFTFYDGPPFATGLPHYGHLLAGTIKDVVTRYAHQTGHYVERRFGWDCHGLPVEYEIDKKLGIKHKEDVLAMGIDKYNAECRSIVMRYSSEWEHTVKRIGRWIDFKNGYKTLNTPYMETIWWVFKQLFDKGQVYHGFKIMPYSTVCATPLSNFEANQNYKDVVDPAVTISFPLVEDPNVCLLAWTTTPWTLPSNLALCVNEEFEYVKIKDGETGAIWILLEKRLDVLYKNVKKAKFEILEKFKGKDLVGKKYVPLFNYFADNENAFRVVSDNYVTDDSGTGIVHQAPGFGEDDFRVCTTNGIVKKDDVKSVPCPVDANGRFIEPVTDYLGIHVKEADKAIIKKLKADGRLIRQSQITHSYPLCWRSNSPLIYRAIPSWYVRVEPIVEKLLKNNDETYWVPDFVKEKRFANWLANAHDWSVSRNRYWGTPIPLWISDDFEEIVCVGSIKELEELSGVSNITDIHRDKIDHITIPSKMGKGELHRVEEVFDCWFESGSMPYAQQHYPFENKDKFEKNFPADFIAEGLDQTRGWFYTLLVLSTHLFDRPPFKNLIVNGLVLAADGKKMSKSLKNYPDPNHIINGYGADALRLYLINSPVVRAEPLKFKEEGVKELIARVFLPWYNAYRFFVNQVFLAKKEFNLDFKYNPHRDIKGTNVMDRWILASCQSLIKFVKQEMNAYRLYTVVPRLLKLIDELTNWYVRFNRNRLKGENGVEDCEAALNTLFEVLYTLCRTMAPFTPFMAELMYQNLKNIMPEPKEGEDVRSIHFISFPEPNEDYIDSDIERTVSRMQNVIELGRVIREKNTLPLKTPLRELVVVSTDPQYIEDVKSLESYIVQELNIRTLTVTSDEEKYGVKYRIEPDHRVLGQKLKKAYPPIRKALTNFTSDDAKNFLATKSITINDVVLTDADLNVNRYVDAKEDSHFKSGFDREVIVLLDTELDESLIQEGLAREVINRVQRLRKKALLAQTDEVNYHIKIVEDPNDQIKNVLESQKEYLKNSLKQGIEDLSARSASANIIAEEEQEVNESKFLLSLSK